VSLAVAFARSSLVQSVDYDIGAHREYARSPSWGGTKAAGRLQKQGVIHYRRGQITVLDRSRLERASCECYAAVKRETDRLLSVNLRQRLL
jgi:hypothetical protein